MDGEAARALEPPLVTCACERLEKRKPVAGSTVADAVALLVAVRAGSPDQLGAGEQELLVEVVARAGEHARSAGAPLETDVPVAAGKLRTRRAGPVGEVALAEGGAVEHGRRLSRERLVRLEPEQGERVSSGAVHRAETAVIVVLPP